MRCRENMSQLILGRGLKLILFLSWYLWTELFSWDEVQAAEATQLCEKKQTIRSARTSICLARLGAVLMCSILVACGTLHALSNVKSWAEVLFAPPSHVEGIRSLKLGVLCLSKRDEQK